MLRKENDINPSCAVSAPPPPSKPVLVKFDDLVHQTLMWYSFDGLGMQRKRQRYAKLYYTIFSGEEHKLELKFQGTLPLGQTGICAGHATDLWRTAISDYGTPAHFRFKNNIWGTLGVKTGVAWRAASDAVFSVTSL